MRKSILLLVFVFSTLFAYSQTIITIDQDTVFNETLEFNEDTIIEGIGNPTVTFNGTPKFIITSSSVLLKNLKLTNRSDWGVLNGERATLEWYGIGMKGFMSNFDNNSITFLDGTPRQQ